MSSLLLFHANTNDYVRKLYNLDDKKLEQGVEILDQWIKKQSYFLKKDFDKRCLETAIIDAKGSIEKAKDKFEKTCVLRSLLPKYFIFNNIKEDFKSILTHCVSVPVSKLTSDHYRILLYKMQNDESFHKMTSYIDFYKYGILMYEYLKLHDYCAGYIFIFDLTSVSVQTFLSKLNPMEFKNFSLILWKTMNMRVKHLLIVTDSKAIESVIAIIKPLLTPKLASRIMVCRQIEDVHKIVPQEMLPVEFGGPDRPYMEIQNDWIDALSEKETLDYLVEIQQAGVDSTYKKMDQFPDMAGSFVSLNFD